MMKIRAAGTEVKVQSLSSSAKRVVGRIRRRVSTAASQALCGFVLVLSERRAQEAVRTARIDRWR
jgi:hypothetical protein